MKAATTTRSPPSRNTAHLISNCLSSIVGGNAFRDLSSRRRTGNLLCFRLTPRLAVRFLRSPGSTSRISSSMALNRVLQARGGNGRETRHAAIYHPYRVDERDPVRISFATQGRLVHHATQGEVSQQQSIALLPDHLGRLAAQHGPGPPQVRLPLVQRALELPSLHVELDELECRRLIGIENRGDETVENALPLVGGDPVFDHV